jgi:trigger factor
MAQIKKEALEHNQVKLTITVEEEQFQNAVNAAYRRRAGSISVPGFRKGKAPRKIIERMYGDGFFYEDAVSELYHDVYQDALTETGTEAVSSPKIEVDEVGKEGFTFTAVVDVRPTDIKIGKYKGLKAEHPPAVISDAEIDEEIDRQRQRGARVEPVDRPAETGDIVVMDYQGFVGDKAFEGGSAENQSLELGSGRFIPGFEDQLIGIQAGGETKVNVTFPAEYHSEELSGKDAVFNVKVHEIKTRILPALDDDFAKDVSEFETLAEYRESIKNEKEENRKRDNEHIVEEQLIEALLSDFEAEIPDSMMDTATKNILEDFQYKLSMQNIDLKTYSAITGQDEEKLLAQFRIQGERNVKANLALDRVAVLEGFSPTESEVEDELNKMAENYKIEVEKVREMANIEVLKRDMRVKAAMDFIRDNAVITEKDPQAASKPKKAARKPKTAKPAEDTNEDPDETAKEVQA